jgi:lysozyme
MKNLVENIKKSEGFVGDVYKDSLDIDTVGYGTKMPISKAEAELLLEHRLDAKITKLLKVKPFVANLSKERQEVLYEMSYQLGIGGLLKFKNMWRAVETLDFQRASTEMLDSKWAQQTPTRANKLALKMKA